LIDHVRVGEVTLAKSIAQRNQPVDASCRIGLQVPDRIDQMRA
jgi:hypothetical protein